MRVERTNRSLCLFVPNKHWAKIATALAEEMPVSVGEVEGEDRALCLPLETKDDIIIRLLVNAGYLRHEDLPS